jgi:hypothetical protein
MTVNPIQRRFNTIYDPASLVPLAVGDRYYAQDLMRDLCFNNDLALRSLMNLYLGEFGANGVYIYGGASFTPSSLLLLLQPFFAIVSTMETVPDNFTNLPPSTQQVQVMRAIVEASQKTIDISTLPGFSAMALDGSTKNYIIAKYVQTSDRTRARALAEGNWNYEIVDSYELQIVTESNYTPLSEQGDLSFGYLVGTATNTLVFTQLPNNISFLENKLMSLLIPYLNKIDNLFAVGATFVQYPSDTTGADSTDFPTSERPATKFGGTWTQVFNTEGVFFRTEGGNSAEVRSAGLQGDAIRNIIGNINISNYGSAGTPAGAFYEVGSNGLSFSNYTLIGNRLYMDASRVVPTGLDNRPINRYIKIWRRTA